MIKTAIIVPVGFDGSGITTLGIEFSKIGFDVYFKNIVQPLQFKPSKNIGNIKLYTSTHELIDISYLYERFIFLKFTLHAKDLDKSLLDLFTIRKYNPNIELCYLHCGRRIKKFGRLLEVCRLNNFDFTHYFSITPAICEYVNNYTYLNINAYTFPDVIIPSQRKNIVLTSGRVDAVKNTTVYFKSMQQGFNLTNYYYVHEGAKFKFNSSGSISVPFPLLDLFDMDVYPKVLRDQYVFRLYGESPVKNKLTIYPSYSSDDIYNRWNQYFVGISCILGSISKCEKQKSFIGTKYVVTDLTERRHIDRQMCMWNEALEYADLEKIASGLPLFVSRKYSEILKFNDERLIYDSFLDIPKLIEQLKAHYEESRVNQYNFFKLKQDAVNKNIIKEFTKEFK